MLNKPVAVLRIVNKQTVDSPRVLLFDAELQRTAKCSYAYQLAVVCNLLGVSIKYYTDLFYQLIIHNMRCKFQLTFRIKDSKLKSSSFGEFYYR